MKKILILVLAITLVAASLLSVENVSAKKNITPGSLIKGKNIQTVYYLAEDGKRYVFPNANTFFSWYENFDDVTEVEDEDLYDYPLAGNVRYKPGRNLIKIQTDPKVYAVGGNGMLHWIKNERIARDLYGAKWNLLVDDVPDSFFTNYAVGSAIEDEDEYDPEEEDDEIPSISHNRGFKARLVKKYTESKEERKCQRLERFISYVQNRLARWGIEADSLGEDYLNECFVGDDDNNDKPNTKNRWRWHKAGKIEICHIPPGDTENAHTITVNTSAARAHLAHGDTLGPCDEKDDGDGETENPDIDAPIISDVTITETTATSVLISWLTDEDSDSQVKHSSESLSSSTAITTTSNTATTTNHQIELTGLLASTTYYFKVVSTDNGGNVADSDEQEFTTLPVEIEEPDVDAPVIELVEIATQGTSAEITWETNELSDSRIVYAIDHIDLASTTISVYSSVLATGHSLVLNDLATSTDFYFVMESTDEAGNTATSSEEMFTSAE